MCSQPESLADLCKLIGCSMMSGDCPGDPNCNILREFIRRMSDGKESEEADTNGKD